MSIGKRRVALPSPKGLLLSRWGLLGTRIQLNALLSYNSHSELRVSQFSCTYEVACLVTVSFFFLVFLLGVSSFFLTCVFGCRFLILLTGPAL